MNWWECILTFIGTILTILGGIFIWRMKLNHDKSEREKDRNHEITMTYLNKCDVKEIKMYIKDKYGINSNGMLEFNHSKKNFKKLKKLRTDRGQKNE